MFVDEQVDMEMKELPPGPGGTASAAVKQKGFLFAGAAFTSIGLSPNETIAYGMPKDQAKLWQINLETTLYTSHDLVPENLGLLEIRPQRCPPDPCGLLLNDSFALFWTRVWLHVCLVCCL